MTAIETFVAPFTPAAATLLEPASISSVYSLGAAVTIAFVWLAMRRRRRSRRILAPARDLLPSGPLPPFDLR
jgi:hypothetical protein